MRFDVACSAYILLTVHRSQYAYERKEAIQKTIMSMTLGKDVSALFPDVLKNIATQDLDQKKLVYLYLMYTHTCQRNYRTASLL
jgi:vesicle coat complex subunit